MDDVWKLVRELYGDKASEIQDELTEYFTTLPKISSELDASWYKGINLYAIYPDAVVYDQLVSPLQNLKYHLTHIRKFGCSAVHILPFLDSPMIDRGYDIRNYYKVREDLGIFSDIQALIDEAKNQNLELFMDLVFNHVSEEHEWFQRAQDGDPVFQEMFIRSPEKPNFVGKKRVKNGVYAEYLVNGNSVFVHIEFPNDLGDIPHWKLGRDGGWYYHTYYKEQLDLNWKSPRIFTQMAKVMAFWASLGFHFRLDAIPFVGRSAYKILDDQASTTHTIIAALSSLVKTVNPACALLVETFEKVPQVLRYFGTTNVEEAQLSYNFHLCTATWVSLVTKDAGYIWGKMDEILDIPNHAEWINFLRNHDELSLAHLDELLVKSVRRVLLSRGLSFREGFGISGRTFSFLGSNKKQFLMAYFLTASFPGGMLVPYGDEIAKPNIEQADLENTEIHDTRNINRGKLQRKELESNLGTYVYLVMGRILHVRQELRLYRNVRPVRLSSDRDVFAAKYELGSSKLYVFINLGASRKRIVIKDPTITMILSVNHVKFRNGEAEIGGFGGIWLQK